MKKLTLKLVTVLTAVALMTGTMVGCGLFEVNTDRDMAQKVATVCIDENELETDVIYKEIWLRDIIRTAIIMSINTDTLRHRLMS